MTKKLTAILFCLLLLTGLARPVFSENDTVGGLNELADGILAFRMNQDGASDAQDWLDGALTENAGNASEWWIIALRQLGGTENYEKYAAALDEYLAETSVPGAVERMRYALTLASLGWETHPFVEDALASSVGEQGVVSWLYGLHFTANGIACPYEPEEIIRKLTELRLADGGWAVSGETSDADVTAMVLQALAPYRGSDETDELIETALTLLSERQLPNGGFESYGLENPESAAQVVLALTALGIDPETDPRFVKNASAVDAMNAFRTEDGGFRHTADGEENAVATVQAYCATVALIRFSEGRGSFFAMDGESVQLPEAVYEVGTVAGSSEADASESETSVKNNPESAGKPVWLGWIGTGVALIVCGVFVVRRKKTGTAIFAGIAVVLLLMTLFAGNGDGGTDVPSEEAAGTAVITIRCDTLVGQSEDVPQDGCILAETEYAFAEGETVCDLLLRATRDCKIPVESKNTGGLVYVSGIYSLYEFDFGGGSGWIYRVNGETPSVSCDSYPLQDGDRVEWLYTCDMGKDLD